MPGTPTKPTLAIDPFYYGLFFLIAFVVSAPGLVLHEAVGLSFAIYAYFAGVGLAVAWCIIGMLVKARAARQVSATIGLLSWQDDPPADLIGRLSACHEMMMIGVDVPSTELSELLTEARLYLSAELTREGKIAALLRRLDELEGEVGSDAPETLRVRKELRRLTRDARKKKPGG